MYTALLDFRTCITLILFEVSKRNPLVYTYNSGKIIILNNSFLLFERRKSSSTCEIATCNLTKIFAQFSKTTNDDVICNFSNCT